MPPPSNCMHVFITSPKGHPGTVTAVVGTSVVADGTTGVFASTAGSRGRTSHRGIKSASVYLISRLYFYFSGGAAKIGTAV